MKWLFFSLGLMLSCQVLAQDRFCGTSQLLHEASIDHPELYAAYWNPKTAVEGAVLRNTIILPVVVHIVYSDEKNNISDFQIASQIEALNQHFNEYPVLNDDVLSEHQDVVESPSIRFELACQDPMGNPTHGITRTKTEIPLIGFHFATSGVYSVHHTVHGGIDPWPTASYINIWVAEMESNLLGRSSIPLPMADPNQDGVVISSNNFGYAGIAHESVPYNLGLTLVHEIGHYFGLIHPWGEGNATCDRDDAVTDTPPQSEIYYDCPSERTSSSCGTPDMTKNIMGYVDDECLLYFTKGQVDRMHHFLNGFRRSLLNSDGLKNCTTIPGGDAEFLIWNKIDSREWIMQFPTDQEKIALTIFNAKGQLVNESLFRNTEIVRLSVSSYPAGLYIANFSFDDQVIQRKIILL